jgi:hypothetical protein
LKRPKPSAMFRGAEAAASSSCCARRNWFRTPGRAKNASHSTLSSSARCQAANSRKSLRPAMPPWCKRMATRFCELTPMNRACHPPRVRQFCVPEEPPPGSFFSGHAGSLEPWNSPELWNPGTLEPWNPGTLRPRSGRHRHCYWTHDEEHAEAEWRTATVSG